MHEDNVTRMKRHELKIQEKLEDLVDLHKDDLKTQWKWMSEEAGFREEHSLI